MSNHILFNESKRERDFSKSLRALCIARMKMIPPQQLEEKLNLFPSGVKKLFWETQWTVERAIRIAIILDLPVMKEFESSVTNP